MTTKILAGLAVVLAAASLAVGLRSKPHGATPQQIAGEYVKGLAARSGVRIIGDKVWSVRQHGDVVVVAVRVRYLAVPTFLGMVVGPPQQAVTTIIVREARSDYTILP